jgi:hypothetical protein
MRAALYTYVLGHVRALRDVGAGSVGEVLIPDEILGAVKATPVPVGTHDGADEVGVALVGSRVVEEGAGMDFGMIMELNVGRGGNHNGGNQADQSSERLHGGCGSGSGG